MRYTVITVYIVLSLLCINSLADDEYGYIIQLQWVGSSISNDMDLILRHPSEVDMQNDFATLDCYYGQKNPDWGIPEQKSDDPTWGTYRIGITNIEEIIAPNLFDIGTYQIIARAHTGTATCAIVVKRWEYENVDERDEIMLVANTQSRDARFQQQSVYNDMGLRVTKFKQKKHSGKIKIEANYSILPDTMPTQKAVRVYLDDELILQSSGSEWVANKKDTKFVLGNPWLMKVKQKSNYDIKVRHIAEADFSSSYITCKILIGDYLGTNTFYVNKHGKYKIGKLEDDY